jgi:hypothetical protein
MLLSPALCSVSSVSHLWSLRMLMTILSSRWCLQLMEGQRTHKREFRKSIELVVMLTRSAFVTSCLLFSRSVPPLFFGFDFCSFIPHRTSSAHLSHPVTRRQHVATSTRIPRRIRTAADAESLHCGIIVVPPSAFVVPVAECIGMS